MRTTSDSVGPLLRGDFPLFGFDRLPEFLKRIAEMLDQSRFRGAVGQLLDQLEETFHLWDLTVFHDQEFLLIQGGGEELVPDRSDRRLSRPKAQELVQVESEAKDDGQDDEEQDEKDFDFVEPKLREVLPQDQCEDADERQDREDDPKDAHTQVPAVQPLRGSDLLTLGAHAGTSTATSRGEGYFPRSVSACGGDLRLAYRILTSACSACSRAGSFLCGRGPLARLSRPHASGSGYSRRSPTGQA